MINNSNFSIRFHITRENDNNERMPGIFDGNTIIEVSGSPDIGTFNSLGFPGEDINESSMNNIFEMFTSGNVPLMDNSLLDMIMNQSLQNDQQVAEKATRDMINNLGSYRRVKKGDVNIDKECVICKCNYEENEGVRLLPCGHLFHKKCIDKWFIEGSVHCPICRKNPFKDAGVCHQ